MIKEIYETSGYSEKTTIVKKMFKNKIEHLF